MPAGGSNVIPFTARPVPRPAETPPVRPAAETPLRVLIVDDSPEDRMVVRLALESHGYLLSEVDNGERAVAAAAALRPDCILLDYRLPDLDGLEVLEALRRPDGIMPCAVVMLTASSNGRTATSLLKAGALDYLDKQYLSEDSLRRAVQGAVERYRLIEQQRRAEERNAQLAAIVGSSADAIFSVGTDLVVRSWNAGAEALFGYTESEAAGRSIDDLLIPAHKREERTQLYQAVCERRLAVRAESERQHKDGRLVPVEINASPMLDADGRVIALSLIMRDISERKRDEAALLARNDRLAQIAQASSRLVLETTEEALGARSVLTGLAEALGYELLFHFDADEPARRLRLAASTGLTPAQRGAFAEIRFGQYLCGLVAERRKPLVVESLQTSVYPEAQSLRDAGVSFYAGFPLLAQGVLLGTVAFATRTREKLRDGELQHIQTVCDLAATQLARARAGAELRASEARLALFVEHAPAAIAMFDRDMRYLAASRRYAVDYGLSEGTVLAGRSHSEAFPDAPQYWRDIHARVLAGEELSQEEDPFPRADGRTDWVRWTMTPWRAADGSVGGALLLSEVRTEQVEARRALAESEARLKLALEASATGVWDCDLASGRVTWSGHIYPIFGVERFDGTREAFFRFVHPEDTDRLLTAVNAALASGTLMTEFRIVRPDGTVRWVENHAMVLRNAAGEPARLLGTVSDVTERKLTADTLAIAAERALIAQQAGRATVYDFVPATGEVVRSSTMADILGYGPDDLAATADAWRELIHPDDAERVWREAQAGIGSGIGFAADYRVRHKDGRYVWVHDRNRVVRWRDGKPDRVVGMVFDISEQKAREKQLVESAQRLRLAVSAAHGLVYDIDFTANRRAITVGLEQVTGYAADTVALTSEWWHTRIHPEDHPAHMARLAEILASGGPSSSEYRIRHAAGHWIWVEDHCEVETGRDGKPTRMVGVISDITERKRREEHTQLLLREVNHRAKNMLGLVQAVARQTAATRPDDFVTRFGQRVQALAASQDLLVKSDWKAVPLADLVRSQLAHFGDLGAARVWLDGPPVEVTASASQALGMALHELATNAAKYGALSNETGRVAVCWSVQTNAAGQPRFAMAWQESGGPPVEQPSRRGFGSTVIGGMVKMGLDAEAEIDFAPDGLVWRLDCPTERVLDGRRVHPAPPPDAAARAGQTGPASSRRVLVVEDEALIAMEIAEALATANFEVIGPAGTVQLALSLIARGGCDIAVLDTNLGAETAEPVARELIRSGTPFIAVSGYSREQQPEVMRNVPLITKPLRPEQLVAELERCLRPR